MPTSRVHTGLCRSFSSFFDLKERLRLPDIYPRLSRRGLSVVSDLSSPFRSQHVLRFPESRLLVSQGRLSKSNDWSTKTSMCELRSLRSRTTELTHVAAARGRRDGSMIRWCTRRRASYVPFPLVLNLHSWPHVEPNGGSDYLVRSRHQLSLVHKIIHHPVPQQNRSPKSKTRQVHCSRSISRNDGGSDADFHHTCELF